MAAWSHSEGGKKKVGWATHPRAVRLETSSIFEASRPGRDRLELKLKKYAASLRVHCSPSEKIHVLYETTIETSLGDPVRKY